jgi:DNA (cytosine-5)-methyltransferase 1
VNELDIFTSANQGLRELALFAGAGGGILGGHLLGWQTVCAVELDAYAATVLAQRQNDGCLPIFPIWSDVTTFDGTAWRGLVDVVSGGFPCQDISSAGTGKGITGERSGLWKEFARIIREVRPRFVLVENSPVLTSRGLDVVLGDLAADGDDAEWMVLSAADVGAPHLRERIWILANDNGSWKSEPEGVSELGRGRIGNGSEALADTQGIGWEWGRKARHGGGIDLRTAVKTWPTLPASASKGSSPAVLIRKNGKSRANDRVDHAVMASNGGQLNPTWVEWLMGWPLGWTGLEPLETDKFRSWKQQHSKFFTNE